MIQRDKGKWKKKTVGFCLFVVYGECGCLYVHISQCTRRFHRDSIRFDSIQFDWQSILYELMVFVSLLLFHNHYSDANDDIKGNLSYAQNQSVIELCPINLDPWLPQLSWYFYQDEVNYCATISVHYSQLYRSVGVLETRRHRQELLLQRKRMYWRVMWREKLLVPNCTCSKRFEFCWKFSVWHLSTWVYVLFVYFVNSAERAQRTSG